ncbi:MAG TPA: hypothetical protein PK191_09260 [Niabella sp.]|nr:hypothetical protein [Niabella sp.]HOZ97140.1 hypothetical protein [Niabella sp.]HQW15340.1 hypothetical protein [Niabella sp.]HQX20410.1 hypothetical protein [Niabella sp.]HQX41005.1 hypothetical protein [Niabella sp.]
MKYLFVFMITILMGCQKTSQEDVADFAGEMLVVKDCTGTYLKFNNLDYHICNKTLVEKYVSGDKVKASLQKLDSCSADKDKICYLYHQNEGWVKIISIN